MQDFEFGNRLCALRKAAGLSQAQLGERLHVTNKAVSKWENGRAMPGLDIVRQLADILSVMCVGDWSSDVCSSDLDDHKNRDHRRPLRGQDHRHELDPERLYPHGLRGAVRG